MAGVLDKPISRSSPLPVPGGFPPSAPVPSSPPRLVNGDRLKRPEFHRRYRAMPGVTRAELIEGIVYIPSPVRLRAHSRPHFHVVSWLGCYAASTPYTEGGDNGTVSLDLDNEAQPDAYLRIVEAAGGASRTNAADYLEGPPELIFEIAGSTANYDLHQKWEAYRRNGVQEYAVWRTEDGAIDWWQLVDGDYTSLPADAAGIVSSRVFPGLLLDIPALLQDRIADVMATLQRGLASSGHLAWTESLKARVR